MYSQRDSASSSILFLVFIVCVEGDMSVAICTTTVMTYLIKSEFLNREKEILASMTKR